MADILRHITNSEDFIERRKNARLDVPIKVEYKIIEDVSGGQGVRISKENAVTKDISVGGCLLLVAEELALNTELELKILLGDSSEEALTIKGRVQRLNRAEKNLYEYGISFAEISKEARRLFADYFFARMYEMIGLSEWPTDKRTKEEK